MVIIAAKEDYNTLINGLPKISPSGMVWLAVINNIWQPTHKQLIDNVVPIEHGRCFSIINKVGINEEER